MNILNSIRASLVLTLSILGGSISQGQQDDAPELKTETVVKGLSFPASLAIHPVSKEVYVAEMAAGKVIRIEIGKTVDVVKGFATNKWNPVADELDVEWDAGPGGIGFDFSGDLYVSTAGLGKGKDAIYRFRLPKTKTVEIKQALSEVQIAKTSSAVGEGGFLDLGVGAQYVYAAAADGDQKKKWVVRGSLKNDKIILFRRFSTTEPVFKSGITGSFTVGPNGQLVVGSWGVAGKPDDSRIAFIEGDKGNILADFELDQVKDLIDIVYSPDGQQLFVLDHDFSDPKSGGLYQLEAKLDGSGCEVKKLMELASPTSMAFNDQGKLLITLAEGKLISVEGLVESPAKVEKK